MKKVILLICSYYLTSCSHYGSINLQTHEFISAPEKIIWYHIPGLSEEHISLLKFFYKDSSIQTSFEQTTCYGKTWSYNLYDVRPSARESFLSQVVGTKNVKNSCEIYSFKPIWSYLSDLNFKTGILEKSREEDSLEQALQCGSKSFLDQTVLWKMTKSSGKQFHYQEKNDFQKGEVYYDKACQSGECFNTLLNNIKGLLGTYFSNAANQFLLVKDSSLLESLENKDIKKMRDSLLEAEKVFEYLLDLQKKNPEILVLVTTSRSIPVELPDKGESWKDIARDKNKLIYKKPSVLSPLWASGTRAENFCGIYEEAEILRRTLNNYTNRRLEIFGIPVM